MSNRRWFRYKGLEIRLGYYDGSYTMFLAHSYSCTFVLGKRSLLYSIYKGLYDE